MGFRLSTGLGPVRFNAPITVGLVAAVLGLCCCGAVVNAFSGDDDKKSETSSEVSAEPGFVTHRTFTPLPTLTSSSPSPSRSVKPTPKPVRTTTKPKASPSPTKKRTQAPTTDKRYSTCKEAIAHGLGPYVRGIDPEYSWYRDRDGDGVVCER